jgi:hypothetical protein
MEDSSLNAALRHFETTEANLAKLEKTWKDLRAIIPNGIAFVEDDPNYESNSRSFYNIWDSLPKIDGWKPVIKLLELNDIAQARLDAAEINDIEYKAGIEWHINEPAKIIREYRNRYNQKRRELIRDTILSLTISIDGYLREITSNFDVNNESKLDNIRPIFDNIKNCYDQMDALLGSSVKRPSRWSDMGRHLYFGMLNDLHDILNMDWPSIKAGLQDTLYGEKEPIPIGVIDIGNLTVQNPKGSVATKLKWNALSEEEFERLIYLLISNEQGYENPEWLMKTNAPDRGRDISVYRVYSDPLSGTIRERVILQCKHWLTKSIGPIEIATLRDQMKLWEPPRIDVHIIATSGRFTADAVAFIEKHNLADSALKIEMWPESHLERLLASRPAIIGEFSLR